jgi:hypothetical protein
MIHLKNPIYTHTYRKRKDRKGEKSRATSLLAIPLHANTTLPGHKCINNYPQNWNADHSEYKQADQSARSLAVPQSQHLQGSEGRDLNGLSFPDTFKPRETVLKYSVDLKASISNRFFD